MTQAAISAPASSSMLGAAALIAVVGLWSVTGCSSQPSANTDGATTTSGSQSTTSSETSTSGTETEGFTTTGDGDGDGSTTNGTNDTSLSFYAGSDNWDWAGVSECDPFSQDCPDGEKCVAYASSGGPLDANKCVPVTGDAPPGDPCLSGGLIEATDDCDETSFCWYLDDQFEGTCVAFCTGTADAPICPESSACLYANEGNVNLCLATCDPLMSSCPAGQTCDWTSFDFLCMSGADDPIPGGEPCDAIATCEPGLACVAAEILPECQAAACCTEYCSLDDPNFECPDPNAGCEPFFEQDMAPAGYENVGVCVVPL